MSGGGWKGDCRQEDRDHQHEDREGWRCNINHHQQTRSMEELNRWNGYRKAQEEEWKEGHRRKNYMGDKYRQVKTIPTWKKSLPFYVSNLPEGCNNSMLWQTFGTFSSICDAYVARKKDKGGNLFGFIRMSEFSDVQTFFIV
ncbi:hypothetical protein L1987_20680 [Smallanthus sonchifolius]|uniref:Uncharacterized protein n=1 Tax=Smallanthus sonchifolius TaxID=185202 RepID=A0ACB9IV86_9ASTR|nr:hypothetical protein L1987_20680 [Smallanthus sonchifolius]